MYSNLNCCDVFLLLGIPYAHAEDAGKVAQANNPLANLTAFNIHSYYIGELSGTEQAANQFWLRYAKAFTIGESSWLLRASLPYNSFPTPVTGNTSSGLGDFNAFAAWLIDTGNPAISFGIGPQLTLPTATDDILGSDKWSAGLANALFNATSKKFQYGYLLTWQHSFAGEGGREDVNVGTLQPFAFYQLGGGTYLDLQLRERWLWCSYWSWYWPGDQARQNCLQLFCGATVLHRR